MEGPKGVCIALQGGNRSKRADIEDIMWMNLLSHAMIAKFGASGSSMCKRHFNELPSQQQECAFLFWGLQNQTQTTRENANSLYLKQGPASSDLLPASGC